MWDLMPDFKQRLTRPEGQTLVEFALVTVLFLMLLFGITEFSRALWTWNAIVHATREGARYAVVEAPTSTDTEVIKYVVYHDPAATASSTPVVPGLSESNVAVAYLKRSEEHTSELQSLTNLVCRLLLEKKTNTVGPQLV